MPVRVPLEKSLQGFVQRKLDKFEINLPLFVIICNCGTYYCHFPFVWCFNVINISEMHAKLVVSYYSFVYRK